MLNKIVFVHAVIIITSLTSIITFQERNLLYFSFSISLSLICVYYLFNMYKHNNQKIRQMKHIIHDTQRYNNIKDLMLQVSNSIVTIKNNETLFQMIVDSAVEIIDKADMASILIKMEDGTFVFKGLYGCSLEEVSDIKLLKDETFLRNYDSNTGTSSVIINHFEKFNEEHMNKDTLNKFSENDLLSVKSTICTPIIVDGQLYGFFNVDSTKDHDIFSKDDQIITEYLSGQLSIAISNHSLFEKTLYLSRYDGLTKVYHRHYFEELYSNAYKRAIRYDERFCICILDMNNLKIINDVYGHLAGDMAIAHFADVLKSNFRKSDIIGRYGGDEFVIIILNSDREEIESKINSIHATLNNTPIYYNKRSLTISFSSGVAAFPEDGIDNNDLLKLADSRMYDNKKKIKQKAM